MKLNKLSALLVFAGVHASAYEYQISCAEKKLTRFENVTVNQNTDECKAFLANGYLNCFDSKKPNQSSELMTLSMPNDHYYQSKESTKYHKKTMQEIIDSAIKAGNDPYLALAIVVTENPPLTGRKVVGNMTSAQSYASDYGTIPLDAIAVGDTMGCDRESTGYDNGLVDLKNRSPRLKKFIEDPAGKDHTVCLENFAVGQSATFIMVDKPRENECCMVVKANPAGFVHEPIRDEDRQDQVFSYPGEQLRSKILDMMAHKYMQNRFISAGQRSVGMRLPEEKMAMYAQSFNGFGKFGVTEPMSNQCLYKVHMGTTPVYGAGTSEIMLNSLMNNSEIENMVSESLKRQKKAHPESYLCASYGSGEHKVSGYAFTGLLGNYLADRKTCPQHTNKLKGLSRFAQASIPSSENSSTGTSSSGGDAKRSNPAGDAK